MPQERHNPFPMPTPQEISQWQNATDPATAAARNVMVRNIHGLFRRPFLRGDCDSAPILQGVRDLTERCFALALAIQNSEPLLGETPIPIEVIEANAEMLAILEQVKESEYIHGQDDNGASAGGVPEAEGQGRPQVDAAGGQDSETIS